MRSHAVALRSMDVARRRKASRSITRSLLGYGVLGVALLFAANWCYQVVRKPAELLALFGSSSYKSPQSTWRTYGSSFQAHATDIISPELLAALAQAESEGNPLARTYWRWKWSLNLFEIYRPASSAVGMYQITAGTFDEARRYCIHDHRVVRDGPWYDFDSCWFNSLYSRVIPSHAIEMTSARLHLAVTEITEKHRRSKPSIDQQQALAAVIHLCGMQRGDAFASRGFRFGQGERCGTHSASHYVTRVKNLQREFIRLRHAPIIERGTDVRWATFGVMARRAARGPTAVLFD